MCQIPKSRPLPLVYNQHNEGRESYFARHCRYRRRFPGDRLARVAQQPAGAQGNSRPHPGNRPRAQLFRESQCGGPAHAPEQYDRPAAFRRRGPDRHPDEPVPDVAPRQYRSGGIKSRLRRAGIAAAAARRLAHRVPGQSPGRRTDPARLRRLSRVPRKTRRARECPHPLHDLGPARQGPAGAFVRL